MKTELHLLHFVWPRPFGPPRRRFWPLIGRGPFLTWQSSPAVSSFHWLDTAVSRNMSTQIKDPLRSLQIPSGLDQFGLTLRRSGTWSCQGQALDRHVESAEGNSSVRPRKKGREESPWVLHTSRRVKALNRAQVAFNWLW